MTLDSIITIIGTIASIIGAGIAIYEAKNAKYYANKVKEIIDEFNNRKKISEVTRIHFEAKRILSEVSKIGHTCTQSSIRGIQIPKIAKEVEEFSRNLNENRNQFPELFNYPSDNPCDQLNQLVTELVNANSAKNFDEIKKTGTRIYDIIDSILPTIKNLLDHKQESNFYGL